MNFLYPTFRTLLYPFIILANFLQNNFTSFFQPMNMGPTSKDSYANFIKKNFNKKNYVLDYGCGAGFFSQLFHPKKYLGVEINKSFLNTSKKRNSKHTFKLLKKNYLKGYENKIDYIFINNVLHHLTDEQILETFNFFKKKLKNIIKKDISIKFLHEYDEIILIGSGKGVASVDTINDIKWKRKSLKYYRLLTNHYKSQIKKCAIYK